MFGRPRCREWTPLATQQLRLRSLIQIVGYNIRPPEGCRSQCSFYLTLHHTNMSAPFYTSERISSPHPKWKDIDSEMTQSMSSNNVVIRIWCHELKEAEHDKPPDTIIQTWGVYFSGLRYIGANLALNFTSDCFKSNTLVFQMHGGYFCSYKSLKLDIIPAENEMEHGSLSSDSSGRTNVSKTLESRFIQNHKAKESRSVSPNKFSKRMEKEYSKSHSPVERGFKNFSSLKASTSLNISQTRERRDDEEEKKKPDPNFIYEHSPDSMDVVSDANCDSVSKHASKEDLSHSKIDLSETAENYDLRNESDGVPKYRYLALNFLKSEIRPSYNAAKLQKLHLLQYSIKKRQEAVQEIKERIYKKSALADEGLQDDFDTKLKFRSKSQRNLFSPEEENLDPGKCPSQSDLNKNGRIKEERPVTSNGPRLTLKLNDLLSFKLKPSPFQRAEHVRLTKQLEILRFKRIILADERDSKLANIRRLKERHAKLVEENQDLGLELLQDYHSLSRSTEQLKESRAASGAVRGLAARAHAALLTQRAALLHQLHRIFYIEQRDETTWSICGVCLGVSGDEGPRAHTAASDTAAAGLAAQATCLAAALAGQPLRYHITMLPKATSIMDVKPVQTPPNIPLVHRAGDEPLFRYAMFLLNKCIAQLLYGRGIPVADIRPTLANLHKLLTAPCNLADTCKLFGTLAPRGACEAAAAAGRSQSLRSLAAERPRHCRPFNRFKECVDGQASSANVKRHRHSRSVGSYTDDQELPALDDSTTSIMGSEPNIYNTKLPEASEANMNMNTHSSDSEICRHTAETTLHKYEENKVVFTLGDDTTLENLKSQTLVRVSTNNEDSCSSCLDDNVRRICTEISDFCAKDVHEEYDMYENVESEPQIDVAKHIERLMSETEAEATLCESCESNKDEYSELACAKNVTDDIIPSTEAVLDTGQMAVITENSAIKKLQTESIEDKVQIEQNTLLDHRTKIEVEENESNRTQINSRTICEAKVEHIIEEKRIDNTTDYGETNSNRHREDDSATKGHRDQLLHDNNE